jgi:hypothetical protein
MTDVEGLVMGARQAAEDAVATTRTMTADPGADEGAVAEACRAAQIAVDGANRDALNLCGWMWARWREAKTGELLGAARTRWGARQLDYEPL